MTTRRGYAVLALTACAVLSACGGGGTQTTGVRIGDETLRQFEAGVTTEAWLVAILGPPTERNAVAGIPGTEVLRYALTEASGGGLVSIMSGSSKRNTASVYFILTNGVVTRFWADRETEHTLLGNPVEDEGGTKAVPSILP